MNSKQLIIPTEMIERSILQLRGQKVMLDADLAILYGVATKRLNEQAKRNLNRFPTDFMFQLTQEEKEDVVANCDHLKNLKYSHTLPYAFTDSWRNMLIFGDNLLVLKTLYEDQRGPNKYGTRNKIKLIYIDPPFSTKLQERQRQECYENRGMGSIQKCLDMVNGMTYDEYVKSREDYKRQSK